MKKTILMLQLFLVSFSVWSQTLNVSGTVTDRDKNPMPGVTVVVEGTVNGTLTDVDGKYILSVDNPNTSVRFSFIGMKSQLINTSGKATINVMLMEDMQGLEEVVVVGYGEQQKASVTAAIASISADEIVRTPTSNLATGLAGKMPGLTVVLQSGELGNENVAMYIRGQATMNNTAPLVLVDGIVREITTIDSYDVETINILKDASATAVYGVRGANGVILVTTKKGTVSKPSVTANVNYSMQYIERLPEPLNAVDYMTVRNEAIDLHNQTTGGESPLPFDQELLDNYDEYMAKYPTYYVDRNFYKEFIKDYTPMFKGSVNMRGDIINCAAYSNGIANPPNNHDGGIIGLTTGTINLNNVLMVGSISPAPGKEAKNIKAIIAAMVGTTLTTSGVYYDNIVNANASGVEAAIGLATELWSDLNNLPELSADLWDVNTVTEINEFPRPYLKGFNYSVIVDMTPPL